MVEKFSVEIPVDERDFTRFLNWTQLYKMKIKRKKGNYFQVTGGDPLNLYWLGANMFGKPPESSLTKHRF